MQAVIKHEYIVASWQNAAEKKAIQMDPNKRKLSDDQNRLFIKNAVQNYPLGHSRTCNIMSQ
jgi:hypothetical protein